MSAIIKKNYKLILMIGIFILLLPIIPIVIEMVFKLGTFVGTFIRTIGMNGLCI